MSVVRFSSGTLTIGRIAYRREAGDGSAQLGRIVIYDCLVLIFYVYVFLIMPIGIGSYFIQTGNTVNTLYSLFSISCVDLVFAASVVESILLYVNLQIW